MQVTSYTFQSPYPNQVQVGRPDPSSKSDDSSGTSASGFDTTSTNQSVQDAKTFELSQTKEVTPEVESKQLLDVYA